MDIRFLVNDNYDCVKQRSNPFERLRNSHHVDRHYSYLNLRTARQSQSPLPSPLTSTPILSDELNNNEHGKSCPATHWPYQHQQGITAHLSLSSSPSSVSLSESFLDEDYQNANIFGQSYRSLPSPSSSTSPSLPSFRYVSEQTQAFAQSPNSKQFSFKSNEFKEHPAVSIGLSNNQIGLSPDSKP
jgi:hypothetical protein